MDNYEIIFYDKPDGTEPAKEFLLSLDHKMRVILTNGFIKKSNKTPPAEKERAKRYRAEYLGRKENLS